MTIDQNIRAGRAIDERRSALIEQGAQCRARVIGARQAVHASLNGEALARSAFGHLIGNGSGLLGNLFNMANSSNRRILLSLALSGVSLISRRGLLKPALRGALLLGVAGAAFAWWQGKNRRKHSRHNGASKLSTHGHEKMHG